jgi:hypothetical protein
VKLKRNGFFGWKNFITKDKLVADSLLKGGNNFTLVCTIFVLVDETAPVIDFFW